MDWILFPAQAGVIPQVISQDSDLFPVPRASGGDPITTQKDSGGGGCSPRKRG